MACKNFRCTVRDDGVCCFECPDYVECNFPCYHAFMNGFTRGNHKSDCEYYKDDQIWSWNETDTEEWSHGMFESKEEAIEDALNTIDVFNLKIDTIHVGRCEIVPLPTGVDSESILMDLDEQYCDETGCENYIYEGVTEEQTKWLEDELSALIVEFHKMIGLKSNWFKVIEQEEIDLSEYEK